MATRLGSAGRGCAVVSVGVSSSTVRELRLIRATVSTEDIVLGDDIRFAISLPRRPTPERREGDTRFLRNMKVLRSSRFLGCASRQSCFLQDTHMAYPAIRFLI